ncbi:hypothetical protein THOM_1856 [Trachipleistophora hominis]|uniref:Uncharacterized protein n=1 Tax=Trachipleistophora hominis TaxID=72359 RepID=L7JUU2_TRAHO|nr:hypothetical protein THOM_1856 [Trachipleistophora hominis]
MQFLRLFLTVFAACCMFVYEDTKEKDKEKGEVRNDKEIVNESVGRSLELDELKKLWSEYCSIVDDLCDEFNLRVLNMELDTIISELEEMKISIKMNYDGPDGENSIFLMRHCDNILDLKEPKLLTSLESLELLFQITFNEIDYIMKLQGTTKLFYDLKDEIEKYASYERSCKALAKFEDSIFS